MVEERTREKETNNKMKAEIFRNETKKSISGMILEQKEISVVGDDLDKVKAIFDEEWAK